MNKICFFGLLLVGLFSVRQALAQCDCPPIEMSLAADCSFYLAPWDDLYPTQVYLSFTGGCAQEEDLPYSITGEPVYPDEPYPFQYEFYLKQQIEIMDSDVNCSQLIELPNIDPEYFYGDFDCGFKFFDCSSGVLPGVPDHVVYPEALWESDTVEVFSVEWIDQYGCTENETGISVCNVTDCPPAVLQWNPVGISLDIENNTETATYTLFGTASATISLLYDGFYCYVGSELPHLLTLGEDTLYSNFYVGGYNGIEQMQLTYPVDTVSTVVVLDYLTGCVTEIEVESCHCSSYELSYEQTCNESTGKVDVQYVFTNRCHENLHNDRVEVHHQGATYIIEDSLHLSHDPGELVVFDQVDYFVASSQYCSRSFELLVDDCPSVSTAQSTFEEPGLTMIGDQLYIDCFSSLEPYDLQIYDLSGRLVEGQQGLLSSTVVDLNALQTGVYIVRLIGLDHKKLLSQAVLTY